MFGESNECFVREKEIDDGILLRNFHEIGPSNQVSMQVGKQVIEVDGVEYPIDDCRVMHVVPSGDEVFLVIMNDFSRFFVRLCKGSGFQYLMEIAGGDKLADLAVEVEYRDEYLAEVTVSYVVLDFENIEVRRCLQNMGAYALCESPRD